jgi:hypothetical protein
MDSWKLRSVNKMRAREFTPCMGDVVVFNPKIMTRADHVQHRGSCWRACWMCCVRTGREINQNYIKLEERIHILCVEIFVYFSYVMYKLSVHGCQQCEEKILKFVFNSAKSNFLELKISN